MQKVVKHGRLLCRHKFVRGCGQFVFLGDRLDTMRLYLYQAECSKCGRQVRLIGTADEVIAWRDKKEVN